MKKLNKKLELTTQTSKEDRQQAQERLNQIYQHKEEGKILRAKMSDLESGVDFTKHHARRISRQHKQETMNRMQDSAGVIQETQEGIEQCNVDYWKHVMRRRETDNDKMEEILQHIRDNEKCMPLESQIRLGQGIDDEDDIRTIEDFITIDAIKESIQGMALAKSPGPDGFPIEYYEILMEPTDTYQDPIILEWLQAVYVHVFGCARSMAEIGQGQA